jgi:hypothetical protein
MIVHIVIITRMLAILGVDLFDETIILNQPKSLIRYEARFSWLVALSFKFVLCKKSLDHEDIKYSHYR